MQTRAATLHDVQAIATIHRRARTKAMPWLPVLHSAEEDLHYFTDHVLPVHAVLVATIGDDVAGFSAQHDGWLNHLYVHPVYWGKGIGTALLSRAKAGKDSLHLWTFQQNEMAQAFYETQGFIEVERTDGQANTERTPDIHMVWKQPTFMKSASRE